MENKRCDICKREETQATGNPHEEVLIRDYLSELPEKVKFSKCNEIEDVAIELTFHNRERKKLSLCCDCQEDILYEFIEHHLNTTWFHRQGIEK